ncbi:hypothetical protein [Streptomyces sp. NPDC057702]|uniref:hypothetical protein n=1 Tax=unclassified Streptomyces TaxID=2593676 RepID=UPI00367F6A7B
MAVVTRWVTHVELDDAAANGRQVSVSARLTAALSDGRALVLLGDRGWSVSSPVDIRTTTSAQDIEREARTVVGPDEPFDGGTQEQAEAAHWNSLADILRRQGVEVGAHELERLPHDVVLGNRLRAWMA